MSKNYLDIYGQEYQLSLIKYFIEQPVFYRSIHEYIEEELFTFEYANALYKIINEHYKKFHIVCTYDIIVTIIRSKFYTHNKEDELTKDILLKIIDKIKNQSSKDEEYIKNTAINFCKLKYLEKSSEKAIDFISYHSTNLNKEPNFDPIISEFKKISKISIDSIDTNIIKNINDIFEHPIRSNIIQTTYPLLDYLLDGGIGSKDLFTIAAYTNVGKTRLAINFGAIAYSLGKRVLHFTFENSWQYVAKNYFARIAKIPVRELEDKQIKKFVTEKIQESNKNGGAIHVEEYSMKRHTISKLEAYYEQLCDCDEAPDMIIIDSPLHLKNTFNSDNKKTLVAQIFADVKSFAQEINKPIIATAQLNRLAHNAETASTDMIGDAIEIAQDSDAMLIATRTDAMRETNMIKVNLAKNRYGRNEVRFNLKFLPSMCYFEEIKEESILELEKLQRMDFVQRESEQNLLNSI